MTFGPRRRLTLDEVRTRRPEIEEEARRHGVTAVSVFGSVARGDATDESDLDLLVEIEPGTGMFTLTGFALAVEDILGVHTQLATSGALKPWLRDEILAEAVALWTATTPAWMGSLGTRSSACATGSSTTTPTSTSMSCGRQ